MSKKRKTRKQKEHTKHQVDLAPHVHIHAPAPTYSIAGLKPQNSSEVKKIVAKPAETTLAQKDEEYLRHDITAITAATGIVVAFDILLVVLLGSGFLHLGFLGY